MNTMTTVPAYTLQAITAQLLSGEGVDITAIVDALAPGRERDVVAVQTALLLKGFKQEATTYSRYRVSFSKRSWEPAIAVWRNDYVATAVFDNQVHYTSTLVYVDASNMSSDEKCKPGQKYEDQTTSYESWETNFLDAKALCETYPELAAAIEKGITGPVVDGPCA